MPQESIESAIDRALTQAKTTRRAFVGRAGSLALASTGLSAALAACGGAEGAAERSGGQAAAPQANHPRVPLTEVDWSNWTLYVDPKEIRRLERAKDFEVNYTEDINDNNEFFGKVRQPLEQNRPIGRDLVVLTDWMAARWIRLGYLEPIDKRNVPNFRNLQPTLRQPTFDRTRAYTLPWQSGMTAIGYNKRTVGEIRSIEQLFDPKFKGKVTMLMEARDSASLVLLQMGIRPERATIDQVLQAIERIDQANRAGQIRRFTGNDYTKDLTSGNVDIAVAYSGDMVQLKADNPELEFVIPEEGAVLWSDNMMIPQGAEHPYAAEVVMDYFYEPEVAARTAAYVNYVTPVAPARDVLARTDPETAENPLIFPDDATRQRLSGYPVLDVNEEQQMNEAFARVSGS